MMSVSHEPYGRIYLADSRNMDELSDESIALVVTSPPTGISKTTACPIR